MDHSARHKHRLAGTFRPQGMMALDALYAPVRCHDKKEGDCRMSKKDELLHEIRIRLDLLSVKDLDVVYNVILALRRRE